MLKDFLINFTRQYHDIGHIHPLALHEVNNVQDVNRWIDRAHGMGHRMVAGHDFHGLLDSYDMAGIHGAETWFDHMLKDFTTHDGIPVPGAAAIKELCGMNYAEALNWLCINASDVLELGTEATAIRLLECKCRQNPQLMVVALAVSGVLGIVDDNPLVVAYTGIVTAKRINARYGIISAEQMEAVKLFGSCMSCNVQKTAVATFFTVTALDIIGLDIFDYFNTVGHALHAFDLTDGAGHLIDLAGDLADSAATLGFGIVISRSIRWVADRANRPHRDRHDELVQLASHRFSLRQAAVGEASLPILVALLRDARGTYYQRRLV